MPGQNIQVLNYVSFSVFIIVIILGLKAFAIDYQLLLSKIFFQGYSRKGAALAYLKRYEDALNAYKEGLNFDPNNPQLKEGVREVQSQMGQGN